MEMELYGVQETFAIAALIAGDTFFYTRHFGKGGGGALMDSNFQYLISYKVKS
jgi:hypothetical protein